MFHMANFRMPSLVLLAAYSNRSAPGDRVLVFVPMSIELYVVLLGIFHLGAVAFIDPGMGLSQIRSALRLTDPSLVLVTPKIRWLQLMFPSLWLRRWFDRLSAGCDSLY